VSDLEARYRRLLLAYPPWYRAGHGEEMITTLLEAAAPGQRLPAVGEALSLLGHGLAIRLDLGERGAVGALASAVATPMLTSAAVLSLAAVVFGELLGGLSSPAPAAHLGPFLTLGPFAYLAWVLAAVADVASRSRWQRPAVAAATAVTVLTVPLGDLVGPGRPPMFVLAALVILGAPSLVRPAWTRTCRPPLRTAAAAATATGLLLTATGAPEALGAKTALAFWSTIAGPGFYQGWMGVLAAWTPAVVLTVSLIAAALSVAHRKALAGMLLVCSVPWLAVSVAHAPRQSTQMLALALLSIVAAGVSAAGVAHQAKLAGRYPLTAPPTS